MPAGAPSNFYPRPPRGGRPPASSPVKRYSVISIHALREEGDCHSVLVAAVDRLFLSTPSARRATQCALETVCPEFYFYPRPPRGGRLGLAGTYKLPDLFLSTPSARRATGRRDVVDLQVLEISIHALREEGDRNHPQLSPYHQKISIHALREEGDRGPAACLPVPDKISIHALREEGDPPTPSLPPPATDFYPRPPRGGRRQTRSHCRR